MTDDRSLHLSRRRLLALSGRAALAMPALSFLQLHTAYADQDVDCPIYLFHLTTAAELESVVRANANAGRTPVTVADLTAMILGEQDVPAAPLFCISLDDGYLIQYQQAAPLLDSYGVSATFFVMGTGWEGDGVHTYMSADQIADLAQRGHEIGSHTVNHADLVALRAKNQGAYLGEVFDSKTQLEELLQTEVTSFCYPNGSFNSAITADVATAYRAACTEIAGHLQTASDRYLLRRTHIN